MGRPVGTGAELDVNILQRALPDGQSGDDLLLTQATVLFHQLGCSKLTAAG